ncbi:hypothetical protein D9M71_219880 [compost metagenome]
MVVSPRQGVGIADHTGLRVVAGDGQGIAKASGDRLADTGDYPRGNHVDATYVQIENAIRRLDRESSKLGQGRRITGRALGKIGLIDRDLATGHGQAIECHRIIDGGNDGHRYLLDDVVAATKPGRWNFRNTIEPGSREAHHRIDACTDFGQQHETVTTAAAAGTATGSRRCCFSFLRGVGTCRNGFLQLFDVCQLILARRRFWRIDVGHPVGEQVFGKAKAAFAPQGQFCAVLHMHGNGPRCAGLQLFAGEQPVTFDQRSARAVAGHCEHLADHFADHTD